MKSTGIIIAILLALSCSIAAAHVPDLSGPICIEPDTREIRSPGQGIQVDTAWFWDFNSWNNSMQWSVPPSIDGGIRGGSICLALQPNREKLDPPSWRHMIWGEDLQNDLVSPQGLDVKADEYTKVRMMILNKSPETDGLLFWRTKEAPEILSGPVRYTMKPDCKEWQEVICHVDGLWSGVIDQLSIRPAQMWWSGDIWIDWIAITSGPDKMKPTRPDLLSSERVPIIDLPGISQEGFQDAFRVLDECMVTDVPMRGFNYPFLAPGGAYGQNWWQLDGSLNVAGAKWVNQKFVEDIMRGFAEVQAQNPDGRIDLWGGSVVRGQVADVSSIPRYFEAAWDVARRSSDLAVQELIYDSMKKYLRYWFSGSKRDQSTGLITAVFEESLGGVDEDPGILAAVDLNVAVAIGCYHASQLAQFLGYQQEAHEYNQKFDQLSQSINQHLWSNEIKAYLNYNVREQMHYPRLISSTFDPLQFGIAPTERIEELLSRLLDPELFNWGIRPVTSIAKTEPAYVEAEGTYDGSAWLGDIWTMRNLPVIKGLESAGRHDLAAVLAWSTIQTFHSNYSEYAVPTTGIGEGVQRYGWTASQYIETIVEHLFGIDYDQLNKRVRVLPHIPEQLIGKRISIRNLVIPGKENTWLSLSMIRTSVGVDIEIGVEGEVPEVDLEVYLPVYSDQTVEVKNGQNVSLQLVGNAIGLSNVAGIRVPLSGQAKFQFILHPLGN